MPPSMTITPSIITHPAPFNVVVSTSVEQQSGTIEMVKRSDGSVVQTETLLANPANPTVGLESDPTTDYFVRVSGPFVVTRINAETFRVGFTP